MPYEDNHGLLNGSAPRNPGIITIQSPDARIHHLPSLSDYRIFSKSSSPLPSQIKSNIHHQYPDLRDPGTIHYIDSRNTYMNMFVVIALHGLAIPLTCYQQDGYI